MSGGSCGFSISSLRCFSCSFPCPPCQGPQGWLLGSSLPTIPHPGSLSHAGDLDGVSSPPFPRAVLAVVGAARPLASATPGLRHPPVFLEGFRQQPPPGGALWDVGVPPDPALLSSSSPYRAPSPAWPSSRSSRTQLLRTAAASRRLPPAGAPRGIIPGPPGPAAPASAAPTDSAAHRTSLAAVHPPPDTLFSWGFPAFFLYFFSIASRLGPPGCSLEPRSGLWLCLPPRQPAEGSPREGYPPLDCLLLPAPELCVPLVPLWSSRGRPCSAPGAAAGSSIRIPSMFQWSAVNHERRAGSPGARRGGRGAGSGRTATLGLGGILGGFPGERRREEGLLFLLLPAGNRERENS